MLKELRSLSGRIAVLALPLTLSICAYVWFDPFKVLRHHDRFYDGEPVDLNRDFVSTEIFLSSYLERRPNAFILGNSRSLAFSCAEWAKYLSADARPFHFDAWNESLFGVWLKLRFLDNRGIAIRNALLVIDNGVLRQTADSNSRLFRKHPALSDSSSLAFQRISAASFFSHAFMLKYFDWKVFHVNRGYMSRVFDFRKLSNNAVNNDLFFTSYEEQLSRLGEDGYYKLYGAVFTPRVAGESPAVVSTVQETMLAEMDQILNKHKTHVEVVVNPLYDQQRLSPADRASLERHFGASHVHDFSGVNEWTEDVRNFYETSHYRPKVARVLLAKIYAAVR